MDPRVAQDRWAVLVNGRLEANRPGWAGTQQSKGISNHVLCPNRGLVLRLTPTRGENLLHQIRRTLRRRKHAVEAPPDLVVVGAYALGGTGTT